MALRCAPSRLSHLDTLSLCDLIIFQRTFRPSNQKQEAEHASVEDYQSQLVKDVQPFIECFRSARSVGSQLKIVPTWPVLGRVELSGGSPGNQSSGYIGGGSESFTDLGEGINN